MIAAIPRPATITMNPSTRPAPSKNEPIIEENSEMPSATMMMPAERSEPSQM